MHRVSLDNAPMTLVIIFVWLQCSTHITRLCFYQTRSAWSMDQGSTREGSVVHNFAPTVTKFCGMWEGQALPHDTKFCNCRGEIVDKKVIFTWSLIHGLSWSGLIKAEPDIHVMSTYHLPCYKMFSNIRPTIAARVQFGLQTWPPEQRTNINICLLVVPSRSSGATWICRTPSKHIFL